MKTHLQVPRKMCKSVKLGFESTQINVLVKCARRETEFQNYFYKILVI